MWLGVGFVFCAIAAVILQAWLWSFPMDPPGDPKGKSLAPRSWTNVHRIVGLLYVLIYVVLMTQMVPRLWSYQVELPARTVMHAVMGIVIGVLLVTKFAIIRFFQHFGKALPTIGLGLLTCTLILATLSIPFAVRAHGIGVNLLAADNRARVLKILGGLGLADTERLATAAGLEQGQTLLTTKCVVCHDLRTILIKPRTGKGWLDTVTRMAEKPSFGAPIRERDVPYITAYLVALTPNLQESVERKAEGARAQVEQIAEIKNPTSAAPTLDLVKTKALYEDQCTQCHKLAKVDKHGKDDEAGWRKIVTRMIEENDAELDANQARDIVGDLAATRAK